MTDLEKEVRRLLTTRENAALDTYLSAPGTPVDGAIAQLVAFGLRYVGDLQTAQEA